MSAKKAEVLLKTELESMRHLWAGIEGDLVRLGVNSLRELRDWEPEELFKAYCVQKGQEFDLCVRDTFTSLVEFSKTGEPRAWWRFTRERSFPKRAKHEKRK
jgi:hypothetical protein